MFVCHSLTLSLNTDESVVLIDFIGSHARDIGHVSITFKPIVGD